ncbi:MAG: HAD hydrolase family protein [Helicobacter sp.]|nr:HAD hydrolase family protein [Helicobacter sp.]
MKHLIIDLDGTLTIDTVAPYKDKPINTPVVEKLKEYHSKGFKITIYTSRSMRSTSGNIGKINIETLPQILEWLNKNAIPYDEVIVGKPWCGEEGFYVDDKAIRPSEFTSLDYEEIIQLLACDNSSKKK